MLTARIVEVLVDIEGDEKATMEQTLTAETQDQLDMLVSGVLPTYGRNAEVIYEAIAA